MIAQCHEQHANYNLRYANWRQHQYGCALGQKVLKKVHELNKLGVRTTILTTLGKPIVNIELHPNLIACINICNVILHH